MADVFIKWQIQPLSRILFLFFTGNLVAEFLAINLFHSIAVVCIFGISVFYCKDSTKVGLLLCLFIFFNGVLNFKLQSRKVEKLLGDYHFAQVLPEPSCKNSKVVFDVRLLASYVNCQWIKITGNSRVDFKATNIRNLEIGDYIFINGTIENPTNNSLPMLFDYGKYLHTNGIDYCIRADSNKLMSISNSNFNIHRIAIQTREKFINNIAQHNIRKDLLAVISALILGAKSELDRQLVSEYTQSGIVHILAVSGLHVGLLYIAFLFLLNPFKKLIPKSIFVLIVLSFLWFYAVLTGFSASVVRATAMCSFVLIATTFNLKITNFNLLASVAFFMICNDAFIWQQLGFQLSFVAVWSIFAFNSVLVAGNKFENWFLRNVIKAASLSLVAQLATTPLCLYYFGTFPSYFLIANLVAVPLSTFLTYLGVSAMILGNVPKLGFYLSKFLEKGISWMNDFVHFISSLPYSTINYLYLSAFEAICLALIIFCLSILSQRIQLIKINLILFFLLAFSFIQTFELLFEERKTKFFIVSRNDKTQIAIVKSRKCVVFNFWSRSALKILDNSIIQVLNHSNINNNKILYVDLSSISPSRNYYFRYLRKCVLAS
jgi:competence protein ComEC